MKNYPEMYCRQMEEVKNRVALVCSVVDGSRSIGEGFDVELVCVQVRKILELIAFALLTANKIRYATTDKNFTRKWNAKKLLEDLKKLHPGCYPCPVYLDDQEEPGAILIKKLKDGFLTQAEFVYLYDKCSAVIHTRNPFSTREITINFGRSIAEWVVRIQKLLSEHCMHPADSENRWFIRMSDPKDGKVHAYIATPQ